MVLKEETVMRYFGAICSGLGKDGGLEEKELSFPMDVHARMAKLFAIITEKVGPKPTLRSPVV